MNTIGGLVVPKTRYNLFEVLRSTPRSTGPETGRVSTSRRCELKKCKELVRYKNRVGVLTLIRQKKDFKKQKTSRRVKRLWKSSTSWIGSRVEEFLHKRTCELVRIPFRRGNQGKCLTSNVTRF